MALCLSRGVWSSDEGTKGEGMPECRAESEIENEEGRAESKSKMKECAEECRAGFS
jgi:hypothetical protein